MRSSSTLTTRWCTCSSPPILRQYVHSCSIKFLFDHHHNHYTTSTASLPNSQFNSLLLLVADDNKREDHTGITIKPRSRTRRDSSLRKTREASSASSTSTTTSSDVSTATVAATTKKSKTNALPYRYWKNPSNQRQFLERIAPELNVKKLDDWYNVRVKEVRAKKGGAALLNRYGSSLLRLLQAAYPEHPWRVPTQRFKVDLGDGNNNNDNSETKVSRGYWRNVENQRKFFDNLARELHIEHKDDWYRVTVEQVRRARGGKGVLNYHGCSLFRALQAVYPEHEWQNWRFARISNEASANDQLLRDYVAALAKQLCVEKPSDWGRVSMRQVQLFGGYGYIRRNGGLFTVLRRLYPEHQHDWDAIEEQQQQQQQQQQQPQQQRNSKNNRKSFARAKKSSQRWLMIVVKQLFPNEEILEEFRHPELRFSGSTESMELDVYIPSLSIAFEYHGEQHYRIVSAFGPQSSFERQDEEKRLACEKAGITLIAVPYWWDRTLESIAATVHRARPDLVPEAPLGAVPIPLAPPPPGPPGASDVAVGCKLNAGSGPDT